MAIRQSHIYRNLGTYIFLVILALFVLFPLLITFSQSLMTTQQVNRCIDPPDRTQAESSDRGP